MEILSSLYFNQIPTIDMKKMIVSSSRSSLDEVVFQNRNKSYGAYAMRSEYQEIVTRALIIGVGAATLAIMIPFILSNSFNNTESATENVTPSSWVMIDPVSPVEKKDPPKTLSVPADKIKTVDTSVPIPKREVVKEKQPIAKEELSNALASVETSAGKEITATPPLVAPGPEVSPGASEPTEEKVISPPESNEVMTLVDEKALYKGGIDQFRNQVVQRFNTSAFENTGELYKTSVVFVIEKDGSLSHVKASGPSEKFNKEAERTVRSIRGKWQPAKVGGKAVRSYFNFPVSMQFE